MPTAMGQSFIMTLYKDFFFQEARLKRFERKKPLGMLRQKQLSGAFNLITFHLTTGSVKNLS
jgi:hypothetical protein